MIRSMTGFGGAERACGDYVLRAEARSVNHKDLKLSLRLPDVFRAKEVELQRLLESKLSRGSVHFTLDCLARSLQAGTLVDRARVAAYVRELKELAKAEGVPFQADLAVLLRLPDALRNMATDEQLQERLWPDAVAAVEAALAAMVEMRCAEGRNLRKQFADICDCVERLVGEIEQEQGGFLVAYRDRLRERITRLLEGTDAPVDEQSLAREAAYYADRCDVSEEIARLRSHLKQFRAALDATDEPVGRKMEFIGQEMLREAGTIGAKVPNGRQVQQVLELRTQVDRLREQVRNVE